MNFKDLLIRVRMEAAADLISKTDLKTYEAAEQVGFTDPRHFSALFKRVYGKTPFEYKRERQGG
jgi:two-component system response regulator YesN